LASLAMTLIMVITPVHMHHEHHSAGEISVVFMAHTLGMFGFAFLTGWLIGQLGAWPMILFGAVVLVLSSILAMQAGQPAGAGGGAFSAGVGLEFLFCRRVGAADQRLAAARTRADPRCQWHCWSRCLRHRQSVDRGHF
jgi:MFS family permease